MGSVNRGSPFLSLKKDILKLIQNKVFLGKYTDRRYVEALQAYRDIIVIEPSEDIVSNLMQTKQALESYTKNKWIGISNDPQNTDSDVCLLWVQLNDVPIGKHWFQMNAIRFEASEVILEIEYVQPYRAPDKSFNNNDSDFPSFEFKEIFTYQNLREAIKFSAILIMTLITFSIEALKYLGDYSIKLSHVFVSLVHVSTPICLGIFEFLTKCVGGLYWLIYVLFRGTPNTPIVPGALMASNQRKFAGRQSYRPLDYSQSNFNPNYKQNYSQRDWHKYER